MADDFHPQGRLPQTPAELRGVDAPTFGHEPSGELSVGALALFFAGLIVVIIIIYFLLASVMGYFAKQEKTAMADRPARFSIERGTYPGDLKLQVTPEEDLRKLRDDEKVRLQGAGWVDPKAKTAARIPIQDAMKLVAKRGLPTTPTPAKAP